jgi:Flp pilus assembly protein TadG
MTYTHRERGRRGVVLPIVTVCLVGLMGFIALAIDIGMMVVARTQSQNAADIAALAGARTLDGKDASNNVTAAIAEAKEAATNNRVLNTAITLGQVTVVDPGIFRYDTTNKRFQAVFGESPGTNDAYGVMRVTIVSQQPTIFARVLGIQSLNVGATATAVHRPRDVAIVLDYSGSMAYCSLFSFPQGGTVTGSLNPDSRFPRFGPWSIYGGAGMVLDPANPGSSPSDLNAYTPPTPMQRVFSLVDADGQCYAPNNLTTDTRNGSAIVGNFLMADNATNAFVSTGAFPSFTNVNVSTSGNPTTIVTPAPAEFANQNAPGFVGDKFPLRSGAVVSGTTSPTADQYAQTVADYVGISRATVSDATRNPDFEQNGYDWNFSTSSLKPAAQRFQGFTMGPGYNGKTFYMWPPDPRAPVGQIGDSTYVAGDWRRRFFLPRSGSGQDTRDNSMFWAANGRWKRQQHGSNANYVVNYDQILKWLKRGPETLPDSLRSGRVLYYNAIPDTIPINQSNGYIVDSATADQRFWKDYIDYVIGAGRYFDAECMNGVNSSNSNTRTGTTLAYNNPSNTALTPRITPRSTLVAAAGSNPVPYMRYDDSPIHPRMQFWFGPQSLLGFLQKRYNWMPGTCYEAPCWQLKVGIKSAIDDIKNNHPNDMASLIFFSGSANYNVPRVSMGKDYSKMQNALFYPFTLLNTLGSTTASVRPFSNSGPDDYSPSGVQDYTDTIIPNAARETCPEMALKVAYNEFGFASTGSKTYTGRRGAAKVVIFETDGVPNVHCDGALAQTGGGGPGEWYYSGIGNPQWDDVSTQLHAPPKDSARDIVKQIVAMETANPPGYSTARQPARVHAIAFGELFEPSTPSAMKPAALRFLAAVQIDGKTTPTPSGGWDNDSLDYQTWYTNREPYKVITGNSSQRIEKLRQALERIMQSGVQVALIQ